MAHQKWYHKRTRRLPISFSTLGTKEFFSFIANDSLAMTTKGCHAKMDSGTF